MEKIDYNGTVYWRNGGKNGAKWADPNGMVVNDSLQKALNSLFVNTLDIDTRSVPELIERGDQLKSGSSAGLATVFFEKAAWQASKKELASILPRLTSCYRMQGKPEKAIEILTFANKKFGQSMISPALLVPAGAAYCDLMDYEKARLCCDRAYAKLDGKASGELNAVYARIRKESNALEVK